MTGPATPAPSAGAALDAEVSRRVFGQPCEPSMREGRWLLINDVGLVPQYSTDIAAAWLIVERLREQGHSVTVRSNAVGAAGYAHVVRGGMSFPEFRSTGDTVPEAICRVAIAALARPGAAEDAAPHAGRGE